MRLLTLTILALAGGATLHAAELPLPMIGGSYGQTVKLIVAAGASTRCSALAKLTYGDLLPATPERVLELAPRQTAFLEVNLNRLAGRIGQRVEILPYLQIRGGGCQASIETVDNFTARTVSLLTPGSEVMKEDQAANSMLPVSTGAGQFVRLGVTRGFDPQPEPPHCNVILAFEDGEGRAIGQAIPVTLGVGGHAFLDLNPPPGLSPYQRIVQPKLLLPASGGDTRGCRVSVQVFDALTGWTQASYSR
jgi:hypothetical protein